MKARLALAIAAACGFLVTGAAIARTDDRYQNGWGDRHSRWENRRDARRAGVVAGVIAGNVAQGAAASKADARYRECIQYNGYNQMCEYRLYEERRDARRTGTAVGVTAGVITRDIVRH